MKIYDFIKIPDEKMSLSPLRQKCLLFILFFCVSLSLMAPLGSDDYIPSTPDFRNHIGIIVQSKMALDQGQFPLRIAPYEHQALGYPLFQFYGPFVYTIAGSLYKWWTPNPYVAFKITALFAFMLAGIYSFRTAFLLSNNTKISVLAALVYMCTPYFIINIETRAAFTEFFAQGLLPVLLFYALSVFQSGTPVRRIILLSLLWAILAMSHIITFVYASFFMGLFFLLLTLFRLQSFAGLLRLGLAYVGGLILSLWMLTPIWQLYSHFSIGPFSHDPFYKNWLTPLSTLLSFTSASPMPLPGNGQLSINLYLSLGLPMLIALGLSVIRLFALEPWSRSRAFFCILMGVYFFAFLMAWSPFDIYLFLPKLLEIGQFSFRLLSQTMWLGLILFTFALSQLFMQEKINEMFIVILAGIIFIATGPWIQTKYDAGVKMSDIVMNPEAGYGNTAYLPFVNDFLPDLQSKTVKDHLTPLKKDKTSVEKHQPFYGQPCSRQDTTTFCVIHSQGENQITALPALYYPHLIQITVDGKVLPYEPTLANGYMVCGVHLPQGAHKVFIEFVGYRWANWISGIAFTATFLYLFIIALTQIRGFAQQQTQLYRNRRR